MSRIDGVDNLNKALQQISSVKLNGIIQKWTEYVRGEAVDLCPVDTGELRQSIHCDVDDSGGEVVGTVYTNKEYAGYVEFGTGRLGESTHDPAFSVEYSPNINGQAAQPFMYPALNNNQTRILREVKKDILAEMGG